MNKRKKGSARSILEIQSMDGKKESNKGKHVLFARPLQAQHGNTHD